MSQTVKLTIVLIDGTIYKNKLAPNNYIDEGVITFWVDDTTICHIPLSQIRHLNVYNLPQP